MNVLSLFDGCSCGQVALERAEIKVDKYFASEIDKYAIQVTQKNYPDTIQLGSLENWKEWDLPKIDLILAGSPCQGFSNAGTKLNFDDPRSKLFFVFLDILSHYSPRYFLLENVRMKEEWEDRITELVGVEKVRVNSSVLSAQNRVRNYWTNIEFEILADDLVQLKDILEDNVSSDFWLSKKERDYMDRETWDGRDHWDFQHHSDTEKPKSSAVVSNFYKGVPYNVLINREVCNCSFWSCDFQAVDKEFCDKCSEGDNYQGENYPTAAVRKFTPVECERLQTLPDNYTEGVSKTQRYKMIGNGWTVNVISQILMGVR